jgi:hypothetical protein
MIIKDKDISVFDKPGTLFGDHSLISDSKFRRQYTLALTDLKYLEISVIDLHNFLNVTI